MVRKLVLLLALAFAGAGVLATVVYANDPHIPVLHASFEPIARDVAEFLTARGFAPDVELRNANLRIYDVTVRTSKHEEARQLVREHGLVPPPFLKPNNGCQNSWIRPVSDSGKREQKRIIEDELELHLVTAWYPDLIDLHVDIHHMFDPDAVSAQVLVERYWAAPRGDLPSAKEFTTTVASWVPGLERQFVTIEFLDRGIGD